MRAAVDILRTQRTPKIRRRNYHFWGVFIIAVKSERGTVTLVMRKRRERTDLEVMVGLQKVKCELQAMSLPETGSPSSLYSCFIVRIRIQTQQTPEYLLP